EGSALPRDREVRRRLLLRLDTLGARRAWGPHLRPLGAWTVESATGPTEVVQVYFSVATFWPRVSTMCRWRGRAWRTWSPKRGPDRLMRATSWSVGTSGRSRPLPRQW